MDFFTRGGQPPGAAARPAVVVVHGGGWRQGDRSRFRALAYALAARGYATAAIEYRLSGEAKYPAAVHDCNAAVRYLRANAKSLGIDPDRIAAVGGSAGGHLVGLMAAAPDVAEFQGEGGNAGVSSRIQAAVVMAGPMRLDAGPVADRSRKEPEAFANVWFGKTVDEAPADYRNASPINHFSQQTPPLLFQTGEFDAPTRNRESRQKLRALSVPVGLQVYRLGTHGCWNRQGWLPLMVDDMDRFLRQALRIRQLEPWELLSTDHFTASVDGDSLRLEVRSLPADRKLTLPRLSCPIGDVTVAGQALALKPGLDSWELTLPQSVSTPTNIEIQLRGSALLRQLPEVIQADGGAELPAHAATTYGTMLRYEPQPHKNTIGYWVNQDDYAEWLVYVDEPARFSVTVFQGCGKGQGGSQAELVAYPSDAQPPRPGNRGKATAAPETKAAPTVEKQRLPWEVVETGHFQNFQPVALGELQLVTGVNVIQVRAVKKAKNAVMDIRRIQLQTLAPAASGKSE
ncbi:MAG: alpha/beta hydrolase [Planctomycetales bacterium]|nr:alpha/beta hydrolase [Planctomycetales bacterium]